MSTLTVEDVLLLDPDVLEELEELEVEATATDATLVILPLTTRVEGKVTWTGSPTTASVCLDVSSGTVTTVSLDVVTRAMFPDACVLAADEVPPVAPLVAPLDPAEVVPLLEGVLAVAAPPAPDVALPAALEGVLVVG